jgi:bis(5'-nucleosidyl)-tetraphosphatase
MPKATRASRRSPKARATRGAQNPIPEESAGVVVFHRGQRNEFLLIYSTYWEFPKGRVDANERAVDAALREVREETGLDVHLLDGFRHEVNYFYRQRNTGLLVKKQVVYFLGEAQTKHVTLSWEHHKAQWLAYDDALAQLRYPNARELLAKAHKFLHRCEE